MQCAIKHCFTNYILIKNTHKSDEIISSIVTKKIISIDIYKNIVLTHPYAHYRFSNMYCLITFNITERENCSPVTPNILDTTGLLSTSARESETGFFLLSGSDIHAKKPGSRKVIFC